MVFGQALEAIKGGAKMARTGWNGKGMFVARVWGVMTTVGGTAVCLEPFLVMKTADEKYIPYVAGQIDVLAEDWTTAG